MVDEGNSLSIEDVLKPENQKRFTRDDHQLKNLGFESSTVWIAFPMQNKTGTDIYLDIDHPVIDTLQYYLVNKRGVLVHEVTTGNFVKPENRIFRNNRLIVDLKITDSSQYTCYLKVSATSTSILLPMRIGTLKQFYESSHQTATWQGIYFGLILFLFIYNLFLYISLRDIIYVNFALFIISLGSMFAVYKGFGFYYLWNSIPKVNQFTPLLAALAGIFVILFTSQFLNSRAKTPKLDLLLKIQIGVFSLIAIFNLFGYNFLSVRLLQYNTVLLLFFLMFVGIKSWIYGFKPSRFYLVAWGLFVTGFLVYLLRENSVITTTAFTGNIMQISSTGSILCMSFALSKKINIYIENQNEARELALETAIENERLISNQKQLLEAKVNQRTIDLEQTISTLNLQQRDLSEANEFKDKVFSIISHDLKSPISSLAALLKLLKGKALTEKEQAKIVASLELTLKNTKILLDNILAWVHGSKKNSEQVDSIEIWKTAENVFDLFRFQADLKKISLVNNIDKDFHIEANENMLLLVLRNLVSNAIKFTPKGGQVSVDLDQDFLDVAIRVSDTGVGIPSKIKKNLFKENKHTTTRGTENEKGTGLGLMLCKEFVDKYNGQLQVESKVGSGTTISIILKKVVPVLETVMS